MSRCHQRRKCGHNLYGLGLIPAVKKLIHDQKTKLITKIVKNTQEWMMPNARRCSPCSLQIVIWSARLILAQQYRTGLRLHADKTPGFVGIPFKINPRSPVVHQCAHQTVRREHHRSTALKVIQRRTFWRPQLRHKDRQLTDRAFENTDTSGIEYAEVHLGGIFFTRFCESFLPSPVLQ